MKIEKVSTADAEELLTIYAPYVEETAITFEYEVPSIEEFRCRIQETLKKYPYLVAEKNGKIVGYAYASCFKNRVAYDWCVETSIYVNYDLKRCGIGKKLYLALEKALKAQHITNLNACISSPIENDEYLDTNSIDYHHHLGYQMIGKFHQCGYKFNRWYDMVWMEKMIGEHSKNQKEVILFREIEKNYEF